MKKILLIVGAGMLAHLGYGLGNANVHPTLYPAANANAKPGIQRVQLCEFGGEY